MEWLRRTGQVARLSVYIILFCRMVSIYWANTHISRKCVVYSTLLRLCQEMRCHPPRPATPKVQHLNANTISVFFLSATTKIIDSRDLNTIQQHWTVASVQVQNHLLSPDIPVKVTSAAPLSVPTITLFFHNRPLPSTHDNDTSSRWVSQRFLDGSPTSTRRLSLRLLKINHKK